MTSSAIELDWNDIPLMLGLARAGSMSAAARVLGVDVSTISRRVAAVETALNTRLFIRSNLGYQPTDAGNVFIARAEQIVGDVQALQLETRAEAEGISGAVRLTAVNVLFDHWLIDHLPALLQQHPQLQIKLISDNNNLSFTRREADFALRLAQPTQDAALLMRKLGSIGMAVYGNEQFASVPRDQWGEQPWLAYNDDLSALPEMQWLAQLQPAPQQVLKVSNVSTLVRACETGLGLALLPCVVGEKHGLRRLSATTELQRELWLLSHRDAARIKRFRAVGDWLVQAFESDAARLAGVAGKPAPTVKQRRL
jgi:DNA-binding transcriptional LysR family regulator